MAAPMSKTEKDLIAIADCIKGIQVIDLTTAECKIADILVKAGIVRFDIYGQVQLMKK